MIKNTKISISLILLLIVTSMSGCGDSSVNGQVNGQSESDSLRELADKCGLGMGTVVDDLYINASLVVKNFNQVINGAFHWGIIRPDKDSYDFSEPDMRFELALENDIQVIEAQHLVWGYPPQLPRWLTDGNFTKDELIEILRDHIMTVVGRYKGKIKTWSVVNEIYSTETFNPENNFWYRQIGPEVIEMTFQWAREADPDAILIWNDYSNEDSVDPTRKIISDLTYDKIAELKSKGVPIDGIGMQMHLRSPFIPAQNDPTKSDVIENMKRFGELGLKIYITEFDVNLNDLQRTMTQAERWDYQAQLYGDMLEACLESGVCESFSIFGLSDTRSWYDSEGVFNTEPLPFDKDYNPKPAYYALLDVLSKHCE